MFSDPHKYAAQKPESLLPPGPWLRWGFYGLFVPGHTSNQFFRFCLVGTSGVLVNMVVMWAAYEMLGLHYVISSVLAFFISTINNFTLNKFFTFHDTQRGWAAVLKQYLKFVSVTLIGLGINLGLLVLLVETTGMDPVWANLLGVLAATVSNFVGNKLYAFRVT